MVLKKAKAKEVLIEWGLLSITSFFFYDVVWIITSDWALSALGDCLFFIADFLYCACLSGLIIWTSASIVRLNYFSQTSYKRQLLLSITILFCNVAIAIISENLYDLLVPVPYDSFEEGLLIVCFIATFSSLAHSTQYYSRLISMQGEQNLATRKKILKMQLDPHFVFNSLNILAGIIHENPDDAETFTIRLSRIYRYIIRSIEHDLVSIHDSLKFASDYVALLDIRFPERIILQTDPCLERIEDEGIPTLSLQLLIENAVKHNMPEDKGKLSISIFRQGNYLIVRNSLRHPGNKNSIPSFGIGLDNLYERYRVQCEQVPTIRKTDTFYEVQLPLIRIKNEALTDYRG